MSALREAIVHALNEHTGGDGAMALGNEVLAGELMPAILAKLQEGASGHSAVEMVQEVQMMRAGGLKVAAYRVLDPATGEFGKLQIHMTWDTYVMAVLGEESAKLLATFMKDLFPRQEGQLRDYHRDEDFESNDPGNRLRVALSNVPAPEDEDARRRLGELIYTASERGILDRVDVDDALTIYRLVALAEKLDDVDHLRM